MSPFLRYLVTFFQFLKSYYFSIKISRKLLWGAIIFMLLNIAAHWWVNKTPHSRIHIFVSFRGTDEHVNMASLLEEAFQRARFNVIIDDQDIINGKEIDQSIEETLKQSLGSIIIFSKDFAASETNLDELWLIVVQKVLRPGYLFAPIFMDGVEKDEIWMKSGSYGQALAKHEKKQRYIWTLLRGNKVEMWRAALRLVEASEGIRFTGNWDELVVTIVDFFLNEFNKMGIIVNPWACNEIDHYVCHRETKDKTINLNPKRFQQFVHNMKKKSREDWLYILWKLRGDEFIPSRNLFYNIFDFLLEEYMKEENIGKPQLLCEKDHKNLCPAYSYVNHTENATNLNPKKCLGIPPQYHQLQNVKKISVGDILNAFKSCVFVFVVLIVATPLCTTNGRMPRPPPMMPRPRQPMARPRR